MTRDSLVAALEKARVQTRMLFAGNLVRQPCFDEMRSRRHRIPQVGDLANTDRLMNDAFWFGVYPGMTELTWTTSARRSKGTYPTMGARQGESVPIRLSHCPPLTMSTLRIDVACPICGEAASAVAHGVIAPFISTLSSLPIGAETTLRACTTCDLCFFDSRYGDQELNSLYGHYRDNEYKRIRHHWEPWYSRNVNDAFSTGSDVIEERLSFMMRSLDAAHMKPKLECVIDFGGDEGQFFPQVPTGRWIVCDVSNRELPSGVERVSSLRELGDVKPDLVIVAHVLEHMPDPLGPFKRSEKR